MASLVTPESKNWSLAERVTIDLMRAHTKTSDVDHVTDEQLISYRDSAIEQAELYTGLILSGSREINETVKLKAPRFNARSVPYKTKHPVSDGTIYYVTDTGQRGVVEVDAGAKKFSVPVYALGLFGENLALGCCPPCGGGQSLTQSMKLTYRAGYASVDKVPAGIILGMLKFISWSTEHSGDMLITMASTTATRDTGITGTNNALWGSGALELFRSYVDDGF